MLYAEIKGIGIYHPDTIPIGNEFFMDKFPGIEHLLNHLGRKERYFVQDSGETSVTMAAHAAEKALKNAKLNAEQIDAVIFVSDTPEYTIPCNALIVKEFIGAKNANIVTDMNDNCNGMVVAMDWADTYIRIHKNINSVLIAGAVYNSLITNKKCPEVYSVAGDGAAAIVLSKTDRKCGIIQTKYCSDSATYNKMMNPRCGYSRLLDPDTEADKKYYDMIPQSIEFWSIKWDELSRKVLKDNNLTLEDVDFFLFSQFSKAEIIKTLTSKMKIENFENKYEFISEKYGYMGNASPFFALNSAEEKGKIKRGDLLLFCTVGSGYSLVVSLARY